MVSGPTQNSRLAVTKACETVESFLPRATVA